MFLNFQNFIFLPKGESSNEEPPLSLRLFLWTFKEAAGKLASPMSTCQFSGILAIEQFESLLFEENLATAAQPTKPEIAFLIWLENPSNILTHDCR